MLTYPQALVHRFSPMANGMMSVPAAHPLPYLSGMEEPVAVPSTSASLGNPGGNAAAFLKALHARLLFCVFASSVLEDGQVRTIDGFRQEWRRGDGILRWSRGKHVVIRDDALKTEARLIKCEADRLSVEVERIAEFGSFLQENEIGRDCAVLTSRYEIGVTLGEQKGGTLPFFSGWHIVRGGLSCFDPSVFLFDLMELALASQEGRSDTAFSFHRCYADEEDDQDLGVWELPQIDQPASAVLSSSIENRLGRAVERVREDSGSFLTFTLHRKGDASRGMGAAALPVSVEGELFQKSLRVSLFNAPRAGLMRLPDALVSAMLAFFPRSGQ